MRIRMKRRILHMDKGEREREREKVSVCKCVSRCLQSHKYSTMSHLRGHIE